MAMTFSLAAKKPRHGWHYAAALLALLPFTPSLGAESSVNAVEDRPPAATLDIAAALSNEDEVQVATFDETVDPAEEDAADEASAVVAMQDGQAGPTLEEVAARQQTPPRLARMFRPITQVTANAALPPGLLPEQVEREEGQPQAEMLRQVGDYRFEGGWEESNYQWSATRLCHGPLYFEEINLERYGYQCNPLVQPLVSGAHFFLTVPTLPYQMTVHPPRECIYTLGHYRPGSRVPWRRQCPFPWDPRAAAVEAGVAVGLVFIIP